MQFTGGKTSDDGLAQQDRRGNMSAADKRKLDLLTIISSVLSPLLVSGGALQLPPATSSVPGYATAAQITKLDSLATITSVATPLTLTSGALDITVADATHEGSMSAADKAKLDAMGALAGTFVGLRASNSANISIPNNAATSLTFNTHQALGTGSTGLHSTSANTNRFVADVAGWYRLTAHVVIAASAGGTLREVTLVRSSAAIIAQQDSPPLGAGNPVAITVSALDYYAVNDWCEVKVYQDSGGALNALALANRGLYATWERVGL